MEVPWIRLPQRSLAGRLGDAGLRGITRLRGDPYQRALRALVRKAIDYAVEITVAEPERDAVRDLLLQNLSASTGLPANDVVDLNAAIARQLQAQLTAISEKGYDFDSRPFIRDVVESIKVGIEADAARGGQLVPLAKLMHHQEEMHQLRIINRTLEDRLPEPSTAGLATEIRRLARELSAGASLATDYSRYIQNFLTEYLGRAGSPVPFGGRQAEINAIHEWILADDAPPYLMLAGPAGRGKSALVVRWLTHIQQDPNALVAFMPVSLRFGTASSSVFFPALQLASPRSTIGPFHR